jgi:hypothetical protein
MYNHAFFNINPASTLVYYRRPSWHWKRKINFNLFRLKEALRKYRVIEYKFGSFINFIYKNLLRYIKISNKKSWSFRFRRFGWALRERRVNSKIILPRPALTKYKLPYFFKKKLYLLILSKAKFRKMVESVAVRSRRSFWRGMHERFPLKRFYFRHKMFWPLLFRVRKKTVKNKKKSNLKNFNFLWEKEAELFSRKVERLRKRRIYSKNLNTKKKKNETTTF